MVAKINSRLAQMRSEFETQTVVKPCRKYHITTKFDHANVYGFPLTKPLKGKSSGKVNKIMLVIGDKPSDGLITINHSGMYISKEK